ncbi:hypothetical protein [Streptomyces sp. AHA2]|uniref:hypothetical protein n=1 Tax=Streptomyces sp. AHA2 TaxID=3064526 RepID=UPI002FE3058F
MRGPSAPGRDGHHRPRHPGTPAAAPAPVTSRPVTLSPATSRPVTPAPTGTPSQGVRGGLGCAATDGPGRWVIGAGLAFSGGATVVAGYLLRRQRT